RTDNHTQINAQTIAELEPDLKDRFSKALFYQDEAHIDPRLTMQALSQKLKALKVDIHYNSDMSSINNGADNEITIDARGFSAKDTLTNLRGVRGEMLLLQAKDINITRPIRLIHPRFPVYIVPRENNVYMVGATQIESEQQGGVSARGMVDLLNAAYAIHPAFADATILEMGADVRPAFPDNLPKLKWIDNTLYINGLFRHGFLLSPACAKMAADTILDRTYIPEFMDA
ncbi:MAG: FAD-dependent oxidoreductase, partial [Nitratireductor sp.]